MGRSGSRRSSWELNASRPNRAPGRWGAATSHRAIGVLRTVLFGRRIWRLSAAILACGGVGATNCWWHSHPGWRECSATDRIVRQRSALLKTLAARGRDGASDLAGDGGLAIWTNN